MYVCALCQASSICVCVYVAGFIYMYVCVCVSGDEAYEACVFLMCIYMYVCVLVGDEAYEACEAAIAVQDWATAWCVCKRERES
jgi:hypothetical protein